MTHGEAWRRVAHHWWWAVLMLVYPRAVAMNETLGQLQGLGRFTR